MVKHRPRGFRRKTLAPGGTDQTPTDLDFLAAQPKDKGARAVDWLAGTLPDAIERVEVAMIRRAMEESCGNRSQAAERLGIRRQLLYQKLARYGFELSDNGTAGVPEADNETPAWRSKSM